MHREDHFEYFFKIKVTFSVQSTLVLRLGTTYYWRIDEVNDANPNSPWRGDVWSFSTLDFLVVDDFEHYNGNTPNRVFETWIDGLGYIHPLPGHPGNGTGSFIGNPFPPYVEQTIVHGGGKSMPYGYDNSGLDRKAFYSETERAIDTPRDWTRDGVQTLSLWFHGNPNNDSEPIYVGVASGGMLAVVYHLDPDATKVDTWTEWNIELTDFAGQGVDLSDVERIAIGVGDRYNPIPGGAGTMYFDDIRLLQPAEQPVYEVTQSGISQQAANRLKAELGIPILWNPSDFTGVAVFTDPVRFQAVPTNPIDAEHIDPNLLQNEDGETIVLEGFDFEAIGNIVPIPDSSALNKTQTALANANLIPQALQNPEPVTTHSRFEAYDLNDVLVVDVNLDTQVDYKFSLAGTPLMGPGALISVCFDPNGGVSRLLHSRRQLQAGRNVSIITRCEAKRRYNDAFVDLDDVQVDYPQLVYYAPPLSANDVEVIIPHYDCGGTAIVDGNEVTLLRKMIPATDDPEFVPTVNLIIQVQDTDTISAEAQVSGGRGPYSYFWTSSTTDLTDYNFPDGADQIQYQIVARQELVTNETVSVTITDKNGIKVYASQTAEVDIVPAYYAMAIMQLDEDIPDFGTERGCLELGAFNQWAFGLRMKDWGYSRFNWAGWSAWERDFKDPHCHPTGLDHIYVDNVDITFYIGHGWPGGFTFVNSGQDDSWLTCDDAAVCRGSLGGSGNKDQEWFALLSCQVLAWQDPSVAWPYTMWWQRLGPSFNGRHQMLGFETVAYDVAYFGWVFADSMIGKEFQWLWWTWRQEPLPVRAAWFHAKNWQQPYWVRAAVMGVYGTGGLCNYNDYLWGEGPVGPDIRYQWIRGYWRVTY